jgi:hypothetical protein
MQIHKVVAGSVLAAGLGVAGLLGAGAASADVTNNPSTNDSNGFGITNYMKNGPVEGGPTHNDLDQAAAGVVDRNGIGWVRSTQTGATISANTGVKGREANDGRGVNDIVAAQGNPDTPARDGSISNAGGKK